MTIYVSDIKTSENARLARGFGFEGDIKRI